MQVIKLENKNIKLVANKGKIIQSKAKHYDEELKQEVVDVSGKTIYLGKNDREENYEEVENLEGETENV